MKDRYICDILAQERILKIHYTIYGDFLKKVRLLSHKYLAKLQMIKCIDRPECKFSTQKSKLDTDNTE
jgi:hypothetical protein